MASVPHNPATPDDVAAGHHTYMDSVTYPLPGAVLVLLGLLDAVLVHLLRLVVCGVVLGLRHRVLVCVGGCS